MCDWNEDCTMYCKERDEHDWWNREELAEQLPIWTDEEWKYLLGEDDCKE